MIDLEGKPKCEIICPFSNCSQTSKLSLIGKPSLLTPPKFNTYNFDRHYKTKHLKRLAFCDISNSNNTDLTPLSKRSRPSSSPNEILEVEKVTCIAAQRMTLRATPQKSANIVSMENQLVEAQLKITELEKENFTLREKYLNQKMDNSSMLQKLSCFSQLEEENISLHQKIAESNQLKNVNINLRQKLMDIRQTVRTFARIKPTTNSECFLWQLNIDGTELELR